MIIALVIIAILALLGVYLIGHKHGLTLGQEIQSGKVKLSAELVSAENYIKNLENRLFAHRVAATAAGQSTAVTVGSSASPTVSTQGTGASQGTGPGPQGV
jgi:hypothetical protein